MTDADNALDRSKRAARQASHARARAALAPGRAFAGRDRSQYGPLQRAFGDAFLGALIGGLAGGHILKAAIDPQDLRHYLALLHLDFGSESPAWLYYALGAVLGIAFEVPRGLLGDARRARSETQSSTGLPAVTVHAVPATELEETLASMHDAPLSVSNTVAVQLRGLRVIAGDVARIVRLRERSGGRVHETVALCESESARFPEFSLQPEGPMVNAMARSAGFVDIDFPPHPDFSRHYHLSGLVEEDVRRLFNDRLLGELGRHPGLRIRSVGGGILITVPDVLAPEARNRFVATAAELIRLFDEAARACGFTRDRKPSAQDIEALAERMPAPARAHVSKTLVTRADAEAFIRQPAPRRLSEAARLYLGTAAPWGWALFGLLFGVAGVFFAAMFAVKASAGGKGPWNADWIGVSLGLLFFAIGVLAVFYSLRARYRVRRLLRHGRTAEARVEGFEQGRPMVRYVLDGREVRAACRIAGRYGTKRARAYQTNRKECTILHDPAAPERVLFADDLITVAPDLEP